jgi:hypothetical protein
MVTPWALTVLPTGATALLSLCLEGHCPSHSVLWPCVRGVCPGIWDQAVVDVLVSDMSSVAEDSMALALDNGVTFPLEAPCLGSDGACCRVTRALPTVLGGL